MSVTIGVSELSFGNAKLYRANGETGYITNKWIFKRSEAFFLLFVMVKICTYTVRSFDILTCCVRPRVREAMCTLFDGATNTD